MSHIIDIDLSHIHILHIQCILTVTNGQLYMYLLFDPGPPTREEGVAYVRGELKSLNGPWEGGVNR